MPGEQGSRVYGRYEPLVAEPLVDERGVVDRVAVPREDGVEFVKPGVWECQLCGATSECGVHEREVVRPPTSCPSCERKAPWRHDGGLTEAEVSMVDRSRKMWFAPGDVSSEVDVGDLWSDVREFVETYWHAGTGDRAETTYRFLTAWVLTTWVRPELAFVAHLLLRGKTTGGKTRLMRTLKRVTYRGVVSASATPSSMFRLIDGYGCTYFVSEYHGLSRETRQGVDAVSRGGQKRDEVVTRAEQTASGHEPMPFDPFSHLTIATMYEPADDIVNRCVEIRSEAPREDMPPTFDEDRGRELRSRLVSFRFATVGSNAWLTAERRAYDYLASRNVRGRSREKLVALLAVAGLAGRIGDMESVIDMVLRQDREAAQSSDDAILVEIIRDYAFENSAQNVIGMEQDPLSAVKIPYSSVVDQYNEITGKDRTPSWLGHQVSNLGFDRTRASDGTTIQDVDMREKLRKHCEDLSLPFDPPADLRLGGDDGSGDDDSAGVVDEDASDDGVTAVADGGENLPQGDRVDAVKELIARLDDGDGVDEHKIGPLGSLHTGAEQATVEHDVEKLLDQGVLTRVAEGRVRLS